MKGGDSLRIADSEADPSESARSVRPGLYRTSPPAGHTGCYSLRPGPPRPGAPQKLADYPLEAGAWSQRIPETEAEVMETEAELEVSVTGQSERSIYPTDQSQDTAHQVLSSLLARHEAEQYIVKKQDAVF